MLHLIAAICAGAGGLRAQLPGDSESWFHQTNNGANCYAGIRFKTDGGCYYVGEGISDETYILDWMQTGQSTNYWIRLSNRTGSALTSSSAEDTWLAATSELTWQIMDATTSGGSSASATFDIEIATDSGGVNIVATQQYTPFANRIDA